jgi:hypothetical protein
VKQQNYDIVLCLAAIICYCGSHIRLKYLICLHEIINLSLKMEEHAEIDNRYLTVKILPCLIICFKQMEQKELIFFFSQ